MALITPNPQTPSDTLKQGRVFIKAKVSAAGDITEVSIFKSSGYKAFDDEALRVISETIGLNYPAFLGSNSDIDCLIPITFKSQSGPALPEIEYDSGFMLSEILLMVA